MSKRKRDENGWIEIKGNPLTKVGVFEYLGREIGAPEPNRIYKVYRPAEELQKQHVIDSFKLLPLIDGHEMLGKNATPAERKGIQGVIGEDVYFDYPYLRGNIKIFSDKAIRELDTGEKEELSPGYMSRYEFTSGVFEGEPYQAIQRMGIANHLARVEDGRTGPDVAVMDYKTITIDIAELVKMTEEEKKAQDEAGFTPEQIAQLKTLIAEVIKGQSTDEGVSTGGALSEEEKAAAAEAAEAARQTEAAAAATAEAAEAAATTGDPAAAEAAAASAEEAAGAAATAEVKADQATVDSLTKELKALKKQMATQDQSVMREIAESQDLASRLSGFVGTFDSKAMTRQQVAEYGVKKLGINCPKGSEITAVNVWMQGRVPDNQKQRITTDSKAHQSSIKDKWGKK